ncbi:MAG: hypothetical protein COV29_01490 [Candidatus Yanofskybacteria bacterium CG10_big_fil_rev_8_21_14_0_10_36_16]|uniref:PD-(D/E)XK endonuclease-like domain-containing protein n=1 Tax=Candidatus Yanofskybacteria bacterium CG10_big_fil_rev_8_21_14_0_10_36_16 TaxID=1975096 RepID=A0A2J0Q785_9BACT|nr:MAG: hypothetical protein COV29_01490 [Candidatus Yanofskybacteria bacterium CG10_big_fil_rev_8_21_14_0_10_36_16]
MWYKNLQEFKESTGYEIDGVWYPRVTSIVSIKAKPALYRFYAQQKSFEAGEAIKEKSAEEGTLLHDTVEAILKEEETPIPSLVQPAINSFLEFKKQHEIIPYKIEERLVSKKHRYAGTMDCLCEINGKLGVLDIKTSTGIYRDYNIQTAAYVEALRENPSMPPLARWILRLDQSKKCLNCSSTLREKGGNEKIRLAWKNKNAGKCQHVWSETTGDLEFKELYGIEHDIKAFLASKTLWEWEHSFWLKQIF